MSVDSLLTEPVTIVRYSAGATDRYGNTADSYAADASTVLGRLEQRSAEERTDHRNAEMSDWVLFLGPTETLAARDRVNDQYGRVFEVVGPPALHKTPTRDVYIEASLRHVEG